MGLLLDLVCPCFRKNIIVTFKIVSFLGSLDNLLLKNVIVFIFENQLSKCRSYEKEAIFDLLFTFFSQQEKDTKFHLAHISLTLIHEFSSPCCVFFFFFFVLPILKKKIKIYHKWFLFGATPGADSYSRHFGAISK